MTKRLIRTEKWTIGKPEIPAYIAAFLALNANQTYLLRQTKRHTDFFHTKIQDIDRWHSYYDNFISVVDDSWESLPLLFKLVGSEEHLEPLTNIYQTIKNSSEEINRKFQEAGEETINGFIPAASNFIKHFFLNNFVLDESQESWAEHQELLTNQGLSFLFTVFIPCILEFQLTPQFLYKQAQNGNFEALEMLVQIDKNIITHPQIKPVWSELASIPSNRRFKRISKALSQKPTSKMNIQKNKLTNAALIELIFDLSNKMEWINCKISRENIFELFDKVSGDLTGKPYDDDFADTPEGRSRAVNREIKRLKEHFRLFLPTQQDQ